MLELSDDMDRVDWQAAAKVLWRAPLGKMRRDPKQLRRAFEASYAAVFAYDNGNLVGMARAMCDGQYQAAIYDLALLPEHQGQGWGKALLDQICACLPVPNIILYAVPGREGFYLKSGFRRMATALAKLSPEMEASGYLL